MNVLRKSLHLVLAVCFAYVARYASAHVVMALAVAFLTLFALARYVPALHPLYKTEERSHGELFFTLGVFTSALLFLPTHPGAFTVGMLVLAFADTGASCVGRIWGRHAYWVLGERRSVEGSCVVWITASALLVFFGIQILFAIVGGVVLAVVETCAPRGSDNFFLPIVAGAIVVLCA